LDVINTGKLMFNQKMNNVVRTLPINRGLILGIFIVAALIAFEMFNYSTTEFALLDLLGNLSFAGIQWATILAVAFCGIDFAGIARLFTPEKGEGDPIEVWYLLGAWLLAAIMNAILTWWGVSIALLNQDTFKNIIVEKENILKYVPIFVAVLVCLIRVLIIGTISSHGDRLFSLVANVRKYDRRAVPVPIQHNRASWQSSDNGGDRSARPVPSFRPNTSRDSYPDGNLEPTYHPIDEYDLPQTRPRQGKF
jgi:hypothetical protein